jgi:hypothetical protein
MLQTKFVVELKTYFMFSNCMGKLCRLRDNLKHVVEAERPQAIWRMRLAFWISKATNTLKIGNKS